MSFQVEQSAIQNCYDSNIMIEVDVKHNKEVESKVYVNYFVGRENQFKFNQ